jgi:hypothetical protein
VTNVPGDGSCGYHALMLLLHKLNLIPKDMSVYQFQRGVLKFIQSNMKKFVGSTHDSSKCAFQYPWGDIGHLRKCAKRSHAANRERYINTEVMMGIWNRRTDYSKFVPRGNRMDGTNCFLSLYICTKFQCLFSLTIGKIVEDVYFTHT